MIYRLHYACVYQTKRISNYLADEKKGNRIRFCGKRREKKNFEISFTCRVGTYIAANIHVSACV